MTPEVPFSYSALDADTHAFVEGRANAIRHLARITAAGICDIGQLLTEVKERLGHGQFLKWIEQEFSWTRHTAERFMNVHEQFKMRNLRNMDIDVSALYLIAAPKTPAPVRAEAIRLAISGEHVTHGAVKAVIAEYNKSGDTDAAIGQIFQAVVAARKEAATVLPSPAEARRTAIATGAHTLDRTGVYQPPVTHEQQAEYKADMMTTDPAYRFCRWVNEITPEEAARIIIKRRWKQHYPHIARAIAWLHQFEEYLQ